MEYEIAKTINAQTLLAEKPCSREYARYIELFGYYPITESAHRFFHEAKINWWIPWLLDHGFLREKVAEETYAIGDVVEIIHVCRHVLGNPYILLFVGYSKAALVSIVNWDRYIDPFKIVDPISIKAKELPYSVKKLPGKLKYVE